MTAWIFPTKRTQNQPLWGGRPVTPPTPASCCHPLEEEVLSRNRGTLLSLFVFWGQNISHLLMIFFSFGNDYTNYLWCEISQKFKKYTVISKRVECAVDSCHSTVFPSHSGISSARSRGRGCVWVNKSLPCWWRTKWMLTRRRSWKLEMAAEFRIHEAAS